MLKKLEYEGICGTCRHAPVCIFRRDATQPILQCDEFDGLTSESQLVGRIERKQPDENSSAAANKSSAGCLKGLCMNCKNAKTCTYPKPEGGVWRCEEYE